MGKSNDVHHCGCGAWTGKPCEWRGPVEQMVVVEYTPDYTRESHAAAGNSGIWPHNGAVRVVVERSCAERVVADDLEWAEILDCDPADYLAS